MVIRKTKKATIIAAAIMMMAGGNAHGDCVINDIRVIDSKPIEILPGEPIAVVLEVDAKCPLVASNSNTDDSSVAATVCRQLSHHVELDGEVFLNRLSDGSAYLNDIAEFVPLVCKMEGRDADQVLQSDAMYTIRCVAYLFVNCRERTFVFRSPGMHEVAFGCPNGSRTMISVNVKNPTRAEKTILHELEKAEVMLYLAHLEDCSACSPEVLATLTSLLSKYSDSGYAAYLSVAVGVGNLCELQRRRTEELQRLMERDPHARVDRRAYDQDIISLANYFDGALSPGIRSEFDLAARWHLGTIELLRAKYADSRVAGEVHVSGFERLSGEVVGSPIAARYWARMARGSKSRADRTRKEILSRFSEHHNGD